MERNYVKSVVQAVKNLTCGSSQTYPRCKNVFFEIMNEPQYDRIGTESVDDFIRWQNTVGSWVHSKGGYLVEANVKGKAGDNPCSATNGDDFCLLRNCSWNSTTKTATCSDYSGQDGHTYPNYYGVFGASHVNVVDLHAGTWLLGSDAGKLCTGISPSSDRRDTLALVFQKPVVFDDDGDPNGTLSNKNCNLETWSNDVANTCGQTKGKLHFMHFKDGPTLENLTISNNIRTYHPTSCRYDDLTPIDCHAWDAIADGMFERYCTTGTPGQVTGCGMRRLYCENHSTDECRIASCPNDSQ